MIATYIQRGESLDYKNETEDVIPAGSVINLKSRIGVAGTDIGPGEIGSVHVTGVFAIAKEDKEIGIGIPLYYDTETEKIKTEGSEGTTPAGYAAGPAVSQDPTVPVNIGFPPAPAAGPAPAATTTLAQLTDVDVSSKSDAQVLTWDNGESKWKAKALPTGVKALNDLSDVEISSPKADDVLKYKDNKWKNDPSASEAV